MDSHGRIVCGPKLESDTDHALDKELITQNIDEKKRSRRSDDKVVLQNYGHSLIAKKLAPSMHFAELFHFLCDSAARDITIVWGDTPCYWQWIPLPMSRFTEVAELLDVCWLEIQGKIKTCLLSPDTTYASYLVFIWNDAFGFDYEPAEGEVGMSGQEGQKKTVHLDPETHTQQSMPRRQRWRFGHCQTATMRWQEVRPGDRDAQTPKQRSDGWMEVELGEIFIKGGEDVDMEMALTEVKGGNWKRGLIVQGIEVRPK
ncbi:F-box protein PP2-B10-like [Coffea arabica]|uniref:F-box protein PP2-B10-like n=1 Tax=Coffea arabica TaxID=13443 RepID=A0ABM4W897_COFAR